MSFGGTINPGQIKTCMDCPERRPACHDHCEKYQAAKAKAAEINAKDRLERETNQAISALAGKNLKKFGGKKYTWQKRK